ncbi:ABC transporter permease [Haloarchaeobius amylolyticus]|uniref:ABC transporter permease n=1 Tax=Haloarchaeobius amylolyticus TaxID=1198296 RepID=UPI0022705005|nr:ABC transporter permease subunit [Haloarchaeobius amylolyticus]
MTTARDRLLAVVDRELTTVVRTPVYVAVALGFAVILLGLTLASGTTGYVPVTVDLLTPVEVLVPLLAVAFGYRAIQADAAGKELAVLRTYPLPRWAYVLGVYLGRATVVLSVVFVTLLLAGILTALLAPGGNPAIATHGGEGSFTAYLRFVLLATLYAGVVLAAVVAVSTVAATGRSAIAAAVGLVVLLVVGLDLGLVGALSAGVVGPGGLRYLLALSPASAFRGLVLALSVQTVEAATVPASAILANVVGLALWLGGSLALATRTVWALPDDDHWEVVDAGADLGEATAEGAAAGDGSDGEENAGAGTAGD